MLIIILIVVAVVLFMVFVLIGCLNFKKIKNLVLNYNSMVCGMRGTGKDLLYSGILSHLPKNLNGYVSNIDYKIKGVEFYKLDYSKLNVCNDYENMLMGSINYYKYAYPEKLPIFISDASLYFPSAYESELKKKNRGIVNFMPLSRHLANNNISCNCQVPSQLWDKIRNQCDIYINTRSCIYLFGLVFQRVRIYEKYDSFNAHVPPYKAPKLSFKQMQSGQALVDTHKISYNASYGNIQSMFLVYTTKSHYDTRYFKQLFLNGAKKS